MFLSVITAPTVLAQLIHFLIRRCHVNRIVILKIRTATPTPIQDMNISAPINWRWRILSATTENLQSCSKRKRKYWVLQRNDTFKFKIPLDRHNARQNLNYYVLPNPPLFSLPSTFNPYPRFPSLPPCHTFKKNYGTHVIKLDIAPKTYPLGQHLFISASNNMFYRQSQWDKRHTICFVSDGAGYKILFLNRSCLGSNLETSGWVSDTLPMCHICHVQKSHRKNTYPL